VAILRCKQTNQTPLALREQLLGVATLCERESAPALTTSPRNTSMICRSASTGMQPRRAPRKPQALLPPPGAGPETRFVQMAGHLLLWDRRWGTGAYPGPAADCSHRTLGSTPGCQASARPSSYLLPRGGIWDAARLVHRSFLLFIQVVRLEAVVQVPWPTDWEYQGKAVGVSLSHLRELDLTA